MRDEGQDSGGAKEEQEPSNSRPTWVQRLPLIDGLSALAVGIGVLVLRAPLAELYGLPTWLVAWSAAVNLLFSLGGLGFTAIGTKPAALLYALVAANVGWAIACVPIAYVVSGWGTVYAVGHVVFEGVYVLGLAALEWRNRATILGGKSQPGDGH